MTKHRTVVITGGGTGMGKAAALKFAECGDKVFILGRRIEKLQEVAKGNREIVPVQADATDIESVKNAIKEVMKTTDSIDVLVNCAGGNVKISPNATMAESLDAWNQILAANLTSTFLVINSFDTHLTRPGGRIINVTSLAALNGSRQPGVTGQAYSAAKSAIHGMTRTLVNKFATDDITINCVAPGVIENTDFFPGGNVPDELGQFYISKTPLGRFGTPEEIAAGIFYLASKDAGFITGEILNINGGVQFGR